jgi:hypothetical protein
MAGVGVGDEIATVIHLETRGLGRPAKHSHKER